MEGKKLFFKKESTEKCRHATLNQCEKLQCWYAKHLTYRCLHALHEKDQHSNCRGEFLVGYTSKKGAALYMDCECLCHKDKYYSPFIGRWI